VRQAISARLAAHAQGRHDVAALLSELEAAAAQSLISEAVAERREIPNRPQQLADVVRRLRDQFLDRRLGALTQRLVGPDLADAERDELLRQQQSLRQAKRQPLAC
jgi:hypothetical protein